MARNDPTKPIDSDVRTITQTTPLRLETAAKIAFPDGSMKLAGLRREIARGRLAYEVIANKHYTTLADIEDMRRLCRIQATDPGARSSQRARIAEMALGAGPAETLQELLRRRRQKRKNG
jgi:hypothetical protein